MLRPRKRGQEGFTLFETLVALTITAIVLVAVFKLHGQTLLMASAIKFNTLAPLLIQWKTADVEATALSSLTSDSGDFGEAYPGYTWEIDVSDNYLDILGDTAERLKQIKISVAADSSGMHLESRIYRLFDE